MQKISILIFPYRDAYFWNEYGCAVRDLHIIKSLDSLEIVNDIYVINRPVSIYERILGKRKIKSIVPGLSKTRFFDQTDYDLIGPLSKRKWLENCYDKYLNKILSDFKDQSLDSKKLIIDFTPLSKLNFDNLFESKRWYDLIDNFTKHNRYSEIEKKLVQDKYDNLSTYDLVTAVSPECLSNVSHSNKLTVANGLVKKVDTVSDKHCSPVYTFGFIGFITNKFDLDFVNELLKSIPNSTLVVYGEAYDKGVIDKFSEIENLTYLGKFHENESSKLLSTFRYGVVPYKKMLSHDESPLKIYKYLEAGKPLISTIKYEVENMFIFYFDSDINNLQEFVLSFEKENYFSLTQRVKNTIDLSYFWDTKLKLLLKRLFNG
jgi:teichuronic acid biosynthesis glycosyltransferase TuaH